MSLHRKLRLTQTVKTITNKISRQHCEHVQPSVKFKACSWPVNLAVYGLKMNKVDEQALNKKYITVSRENESFVIREEWAHKGLRGHHLQKPKRSGGHLGDILRA